MSLGRYNSEMENLTNQLLIGGGSGLLFNAVSFISRYAVSNSIRKAGFKQGLKGEPLLPEQAISRASTRQFVERTLPQVVGFASLAIGVIEAVKGQVGPAAALFTIAAPHLAQGFITRRR